MLRRGWVYYVDLLLTRTSEIPKEVSMAEQDVAESVITDEMREAVGKESPPTTLDVEKAFSITGPDRIAPATHRNLNGATRTGKGLNVDLGPAGSI